MFLLLCFLVLLIPSTTAREFPWVIIDKHQVIFLPEEHTSREDHHFQLEIIKALHFRGHKFFIAMEMFQQPFQRVLDEYVNCTIEEEELLRRTEYFQRWGYDPAMYRSIWRFAKERGIRMVAINISSELVQRIRREGLEKVRDESLPNPIIEYTERERRELQKVLASHPKVEEKSFFDVQNAWDNGMAYAINKLLDRHPDYKVVVLVGRGHAQDYSTGIPRRLKVLRPQASIKILRREDFQKDFLFSMDFSGDSSSASSTKEPNCRP